MLKFFLLIAITLIFKAAYISCMIDDYVLANPERHFRVILKSIQDAVTLHYWDRDIKYYKLLEIDALITFNCDKKLNEQNLKSISIYQFDFVKSKRFNFLEGKSFIISPSVRLPLKSIAMANSISLIYPIFNTSVSVARYKLNGFWFKIIDAAGWANKFNIRLDIENGDEDRFQHAMENIVEIEDREYQKICPYY